jgi:hypothetical protein
MLRSFRGTSDAVSPFLSTVLFIFLADPLLSEMDGCLEEYSTNTDGGFYESSMSYYLSWIFPAMSLLALVPFLQFFILAPFLFPIAYAPLVHKINRVNEKRIPGYAPDDHFSVFDFLWLLVSILAAIAIVILAYYWYFKIILGW